MCTPFGIVILLLWIYPATSYTHICKDNCSVRVIAAVIAQQKSYKQLVPTIDDGLNTLDNGILENRYKEWRQSTRTSKKADDTACCSQSKLNNSIIHFSLSKSIYMHFICERIYPNQWLHFCKLYMGGSALSLDLVHFIIKINWQWGKRSKISPLIPPSDPEIHFVKIVVFFPFLVALFIVAKVWKQLGYLAMNEWRNKMWHIHIMEYYSA